MKTFHLYVRYEKRIILVSNLEPDTPIFTLRAFLEEETGLEIDQQLLRKYNSKNGSLLKGTVEVIYPLTEFN